MDFVLDIRTAKKAVTSIFDVAPPKTTANYHPGISIEAKENGTIRFYFGDAGVSSAIVVSGTVSIPGNIKVELGSLFKNINAFIVFKDGVGTKEIRFFSDGQVLSIRAVALYKKKKIRQNRSIQSYDVVMPEFKYDRSVFVSIPLKIFSFGFKKVLVSSPSSSGIGGSSGIYFEVSGTSFKTVSMDGPTLTEFCGYTSSLPTKDFSCILPPTFVSRLCKLISKHSHESSDDSKDIEIIFHNKTFIVVFDDFVISSSTINDKFPDYGEIFSGAEKKIVVNSEIFCDNVRNIIHSSDKEDNLRVRLQSFGEEISLSTSSCVNDGIPTVEGSSFKIEFNGSILESCVRNLSSDEFCLEYKGKHEVAILSPIGGEAEIKTAVAPLR